MGGTTENPTYKQVCTGGTHHAEIVKVAFDDDVVTYEALVQSFFTCHDPTQVNRQGVDTGTQYRSAIFYNDSTQKHTAEDVIKQISPNFDKPIATEITASTHFWIAEEYHQNYFAKNGGGCGI